MPPQDGQCPFCQLIDNPEQLLTVGETDNFYAWLEVNPRAKGHTMVVPKEHKESVLDFSPDEYQEAMTLARKVIDKAKDGLGADGASITVNIEEAGGQMLPHAYIQVFPRFEEDENAGTPTGAIFPHREDVQQELEDIQSAMSSVTVNFEAETREPHKESQRHLEESPVGRAAKSAVEKTGSNSGKEKTTEPEEHDEDLSAPSEETTESRNTDEEEIEGEGHWDGKSFEWR